MLVISCYCNNYTIVQKFTFAFKAKSCFTGRAYIHRKITYVNVKKIHEELGEL